MKSIRPLIFIIDMVNGFCKDGAMADKNIMNIVPNIKDLCARYKEDLIFITDAHCDDDVEFKSFPPHCLKHTIESEVINELKDFLNDKNIIEKNSTNGFHSLQNKELLTNKNIDSIIITGCCTDICVLQFALSVKTYLNSVGIDKPVIVPKNMVDTYESIKHKRNEMNRIALNLMREAGIHIVDEL